MTIRELAVDPRRAVDLGFELGIYAYDATFWKVLRHLGFPVLAVRSSNPEQDTSWSSGPSFQLPLSIVPPRLTRIGAKLEW